MISTYIQLKLKKNSYRAVKSRIDCHILPYFKKYDDLNDITPQDYMDWQLSILKKDFKYKYNTSLHTAVVTMLNFAKIMYKIDNNVASQVDGFKNNTIADLNVDYWTYEEFETFINVVDNDLYKLLFETLYYTGMRLGECLALNWKDIDKHYIKINKTITKELINGSRLITTPKTRTSIRKVKMNEYLEERLLFYKEYSKKIIGFEENTFIFGCHKPLSPTTVDRYMRKYCDKSGVKKIRIHYLRHSHASLLLSNGVPITVIQTRLGHSDPSITLKYYAHLMPNDEDKAINIIDNLIRTF